MKTQTCISLVTCTRTSKSDRIKPPESFREQYFSVRESTTGTSVPMEPLKQRPERQRASGFVGPAAECACIMHGRHVDDVCRRFRVIPCSCILIYNCSLFLLFLSQYCCTAHVLWHAPVHSNRQSDLTRFIAKQEAKYVPLVRKEKYRALDQFIIVVFCIHWLLRKSCILYMCLALQPPGWCGGHT